MSLSPGGGRGGGVAFLQVLLAMLFLAIIGGTVGYLAGEQHNKAHKSSSAGSSSASTGGSKSAQSSGSPAGPERCPAHTEAQAGVQLTVVIHLHTTVGTDVWICKAADGTLFYQGRKAKSGTDFNEGVNALFLRDVSYEGGEYVARNYDSGNGSTTEYHVSEGRLVQKYLNYPSPKPDSTEYAG
jgi:hypothetical protein